MNKNGSKVFRTTMAASALLVAFFAGAGMVHAATNQWTATGPAGVTVQAFATYSAANVTNVYAGTSAGVYKNAVAVGLIAEDVKAVAASPRTPDTVFAASVNGVWKSLDGGLVWAPVGAGAKALLVSPASPDTVYAGTGTGVLKTVNGGADWGSPLLVDKDITALVIDPLAPDKLFAVSADGYAYATIDGGVTWSSGALIAGSITANALALAADGSGILSAATSNGVYQSTDGGNSWSNVGLTGIAVTALAIDPLTPGTVYAGTETGGIYVRTAANGWNAINVGLTAPYTGVLALTVDPLNPTRFYAGTAANGAFEATVTPSIAVLPGTVDFGEVSIKSDALFPLTLSNTGMADLQVTLWNNMGVNAYDFYLDIGAGSCPSLTPILAPGQSCTLETHFFTRLAGTKHALLQFESNDPAMPVKSVAQSAIATDPIPTGTLTINGGSAWSKGMAVSLALTSASQQHQVTYMRLRNSGGSWSPWEPVATVKAWTLPSGDGEKTVSVQFKDDRIGWSDNLLTSSIDSVITLDTTAPITTLGATPANPSNLASSSIAFSANEPGATFECSMDGGSFAACAVAYDFAGLAYGSHTFSVRATDPAGNLNPTPVTYSWAVDPSSLRVAVNGGSHLYTYADLAGAYAWAQDGATAAIDLRAGSFGDVLFDRDVTVALTGGYNLMYAGNTGATTLTSLTITAGTVTVDNIILQTL